MRRSIPLLSQLFLVAAWLLPQTGAATSVSWPSLDEQLAAAGAMPGSELERIIKNHQDFSLLSPREANDKIGIPPWLRVLWREQHPTRTADPQDPTGGYPRVLKDTYTWMRHHQDQDASFAAPSDDAVPRGPIGVSSASSAVSTGSNLLISGTPATPRCESSIQINYFNPLQIISASNAISGSGRQAQFYSADGGASWSQTTLPLVGRDLYHSDPAVDWTSDGTAWSTTMGIVGMIAKIRTYRSSDGGATWTFDGTPSTGQTDTDKEMMWVDHSATSPYKDNIYLTWHTGNPAYVGRRTAAGWQPPLKVSGTESTGTALGGDVKTNSFGHVFVFWPATGNKGLFVAKSKDGGASFATPVRIGTTYDSYDIGVPSFAARRALIYIAGGAYKTDSKNMVYAAWTDLSGETNCTVPSQEPDTNANSTCKTRIWFARSSNGGTKWSTPIRLNNQASKNDQYNPWLAVDETSGVISVIYYDTVNDPNRLKTDVWYQFSSDDGATWSSASKVTNAMTNETSASADAGNQYGDYNGLSSYNGVIFPSWTDRRNNAKEQIWTARITAP